MEGYTDAMKQYSKATEDIYMNKPKRGKSYGIKTPDSTKMVAALTIFFLVFVLASEFM